MDPDEARDEVNEPDEPPPSPQDAADPNRRENLKNPVINFGSFLPKFAADHLADLFRVGMPLNRAGKVRIRDARTVVQNDGIPLVWVPRSEIILAMISATGRADRIDLLIARGEQVADDCRKVLADVQHPLIVDQAWLAKRAIEALVAGHFESAQALAVVVTETAVANVLGGNYDKVRKRVLFDPGKTKVSELRLRLALAPIGQFYTSWHRDSGSPQPESLSRHVSVHQADPTHYTKGNAIVAAMLVASVLRALQEFQEAPGAIEDQD
jgi:hypothetical protein